MKKIILSLFTVVIFSLGTTAQNVNIPDANFKAYLVGNSAINTNMDSEIQVSEANAFTGTINCANQGINDLTGVEAFTALTKLIFFGNNVSSLDISQNTALTELSFNHNDISVLDVSQNTALTNLICSNNNISVLDVSQNTALTILSCSNNNISVLDVSQHTALIGLDCDQNNISALDVSQSTGMTHLNCQFNNLTILDVSQNTNLSQLNCDNNSITALDLSQNTAVVYLRCQNNNLSALNLKNINLPSLNYFTAFGNPNLTCIEVDDVAVATAALANIDAASSFNTYCEPIVNIPDANFKSYLVGYNSINTNMDSEIQVSEANAFTGAIDCYNCNFSDLTGIEAFTALTILDFQGNNVSNMDLSQNTALVELHCNYNNLTDIDLSHNTAIEKLYCNGNNLTSLDLSQNTALTLLFCGENDFPTLDLSHNTALTLLHCESAFVLGNLNTIDLGANTNLERIFAWQSGLTSLDVSQNIGLTHIDCSDNNISTLDVSQNVALERLNCRYNNISTLDVSQNGVLNNLSCSHNNLSSLDLSQNTALGSLGCDNNNLSELNLKNINPSTCNIYAIANPNLTCIEVDDVAAATAAWLNIDALASFSESCFIPVTSISVQGLGGATTISTLGGTLQMEAEVFPMNATDNTYTWSVINLTGSADIDANGLLTAISDGTVKVGVTANDGSGVTGSADITISNQSSSIGELHTIPSISIFPNPTNAQIVIDTKANIQAVSIINVMGKTVRTIVQPNSTIDVSDLTKGIYFLEMQVDGALVSKKIIKG